MPSLCCYFQVHQPYRLRRFTYFDSSSSFDYFDHEFNLEIFKKVAEKCYLPANQILLELVERFDGRFRIAFSLSGVVLEQMKAYYPEVLDGFIKLARSGCVEFLSETYHHSLAALIDEREFYEQVRMHGQTITDIFGVQPRVFRNTELIYDDQIGRMVAGLGYRGIIVEGCEDVLDWRSANYIYRNSQAELPLILRNFRFSDDIAFRFSNQNWEGYPLSAGKFASWIHSLTDSADVVNLCMDYETFGEHQWSGTGIFDFLRGFPDEILQNPAWDFLTPSEVLDRYQPVGDLSFPRLTSWADEKRDISAWQGNRMQKRALAAVAGLGALVRNSGDKRFWEVWRKLQISDHFYYMATKSSADGDVHAYFSPYGSPYDAFIRYMNVIKDFKEFLSVPFITR
ncbi:MAG: alpha-amylase [Deltaproteobacteria bacterium]|nr:alpha-amylase [Deltaproteobacteria bacterium]